MTAPIVANAAPARTQHTIMGRKTARAALPTGISCALERPMIETTMLQGIAAIKPITGTM